MDAPIRGVSLERYAELSAEVTDCVNDPGACARTVEALGVSRTDGEAAHQEPDDRELRRRWRSSNRPRAARLKCREGGGFSVRRKAALRFWVLPR